MIENTETSSVPLTRWSKYRRVNSNTNTHDPTEDWVELKEHPSLPVFFRKRPDGLYLIFFQRNIGTHYAANSFMDINRTDGLYKGVA